MNWKDLKTSADNTHFLYEDQPAFGRKFTEVLKFHAPGLAPVKDKSGSYHIDTAGKALYTERYSRTFGYYCDRAAVVQNGQWFHINEKGERAYPTAFSWTGNYQENLCTVRDDQNQYYHIDPAGKATYAERYRYAGDFKDGIACIRQTNGLFRHIDISGQLLHNKEFLDLGVFHKGFATARDKAGWHHINTSGQALYKQRYLQAEPFYNGFALVTHFNLDKEVIDESGNVIIKI